MRKYVFHLLFIGLILLFSCEETDRCECLKVTYAYDGVYPVGTEELVDCPQGMEDGDYLIEWREDLRIDYIIDMTCY